MTFTQDLSAWQGRVDAAEGDLALRWHQVVQPWTPESSPGIALVGFASDEGVKRNQGRIGAAAGPQALRQHLSNLPVRKCRSVLDAGTCQPDGQDLEGAQEAYANRITTLLDQGCLPMGLGGGHEIAYGSFLGLARHLQKREPIPRIGILNLDAHFDLRSADQASSGTPFRQASEWCAAQGWPFHYGVLGVSLFANTEALFHRANELGAWVRLDEALSPIDLPEALAELNHFAASVDHLYLTLCLDVLPAAVAPGVSAPAARGVALEVIERLLDAACATGKVKLFDVAELNPALDEDGRTAKVAARLLGRVAEACTPDNRLGMEL